MLLSERPTTVFCKWSSIRPHELSPIHKMTGVSEVTIRQDSKPAGEAELSVPHPYAVPLDSSEDVETRMMTHFAIKRTGQPAPRRW